MIKLTINKKLFRVDSRLCKGLYLSKDKSYSLKNIKDFKIETERSEDKDLTYTVFTSINNWCIMTLCFGNGSIYQYAMNSSISDEDFNKVINPEKSNDDYNRLFNRMREMVSKEIITEVKEIV